MFKPEEIVLNWLNEEIKLDPPVKYIAKEFSNGYRFAQILHNIKELSENQFKEFSNSSQLYNIKDNFTLLKKYFKELYELEIRREEFDDIINQDKYKAVIILYKLKNSISKKNINFLNIKEFLNNLTDEEIKQKVKEIIDYEYYNDIFNKDLLYDITNEEKKKNNTFLLSSSIKSFKSTQLSSKFFSNNFSFHNKLSNDIIEEYPQEKTKLKFINNKKSEEQRFPKYLLFERNQSQKMKLNNTESKKDISKIRLPNIKNTYKSVEIPSSNKKSYLPRGKNSSVVYKKSSTFITSGGDINCKTLSNTKVKFGNGKSNIAEENKFKISKLTDSLYKFGVTDFQSNFKHSLPEFNPLNKKELDKVREELKKRINIKRDDSTKKQENIKKELKIRLYDIPEIDFVHKDKNPLYEVKLPIGINIEKHNKYLSYSKRAKYSKEWKIYYNQKLLEKKIKYFSCLIKKENKKHEIKDNYFFDKDIFLSNLSNIYTQEDFNKFLIEKKLKINRDFPYIKDIILLIIDMTMEIFFYKEENDNELIDIETYTKLLELFVKNKPMREGAADAEARIIKEKDNDNEDINPDKLKLSEEEINLKEDYKNLVGLWNDDKIMNKELKGMKIDYKNTNLFFQTDYEPTETDLEDLSFPVHNPENYLYGDVILDLLDNKFVDKNKNNNNNLNKGGKWDYINYKIGLIGLPFCGKKFIAGELCKKYPNLKIYSTQKILRNYYEQYKTISEPLENNPKFKSLKPNQIEQLKQEKENKLKEFEPILQIIQPYINLIDQNEKENYENEEKKDKNDNIIVPGDEVLLNILIYNIEKDFPKLPEEEIKNEIINTQKNISDLIKQKESLQKQIQDSKKPNPKDEQIILNIDKGIQNIKNNSVKGFILVDFPTNINQCNLLEYYLNGYVDETKKPKSQKMINVECINSLIDFNFTPNENNKLKKAGIDFIVNIITNEEDINERFNKKKYDPLNDKIYSEYELNQDIINKDKKLMERLVDDVPYYTKEHFDYYKKEYLENISKINLFYNMFGFTNNDLDLDLNINILNTENNYKEINKTYQEINIEDEIKKDNESMSYIDTEEKKENKKIINNNSIKETISSVNREDEIKNKIISFINDNIIGYLFREKNEKDKKIFYMKHPEQNDEEEKDRIKFEPEFQVNEISGQSLKKVNINKDKIYMKYLIDNFDSVLSDIKAFNIKYNKYTGKFIHLIKKQKNSIHTRLNLIQKKYRDFLNQTSDKKKVISVYCHKYNTFFKEFPNGFNSTNANIEFSHDIDELNNALWVLINIKETVSIKELQEIKSSNFIEFELRKFYKNIKELFLLETEKFLTMINSIINLYQRRYDESTNTIINLMKHNNEKEKEKEKINNNLSYNKEYILKDLIKISNMNLYEQNENDNEGEIENNGNGLKSLKNIKTIKNINVYNKKKEPDNLDYLINKNVDIIFNNCVNLILAQKERIESLLKTIKEQTAIGNKKTLKYKKKMNESMGSLMTSGFLQMKENHLILEENIKKMFQNEKNKFKYRICFLKSFVTRYIIIIIQTSNKIFQNIDKWIIKSVTLQSEAQNKIIQKLRNILNEKKLINEEKDIFSIEMDSFESLTTNNSNYSNNKEGLNNPMDNDLEIYAKLNIDYLLNDDFINIEIQEDKNDENDTPISNKYNIKKYKIILPNERHIERKNTNRLNYNLSEVDFHYNAEKFFELYNKIKKFEIKKDVISEQILYEIFVKKYLFNKEVFEKENNLINKDNNPLNNMEEIKEKENNINNTNNNSDSKKLPFICKALRCLNFKYVKKLLSFFNIPIAYEEEEVVKTDKNDSNNNDNPNIEKETKKIEYEKFLNLSELFTLLSLIGCKILTENKENEMTENIKDIIINNTYISKNDFYKYNFWFEEDFEYLNCKKIKEKKGTFVEKRSSIRKKTERRKSKRLTNSLLGEKMNLKNNENKKNFTIKDLLFNIWKDDKGNNFNYKKFINVLKVSKYISNLGGNKENNYYDIIFSE